MLVLIGVTVKYSEELVERLRRHKVFRHRRGVSCSGCSGPLR